MSYPAVLTLHLLSVIVFLGGFFMAQFVRASSQTTITPKQAAEWRRLSAANRFITTPALVAVWAAGLRLASQGEWFGSRWLQAKLLCVALLTLGQMRQSADIRRMVRKSETVPRNRWLLPCSALLVVTILTLVTTKPG